MMKKTSWIDHSTLKAKVDMISYEQSSEVLDCSIGGTSGGGIVSRVATFANREGEGGSNTVVDVPQVAEVDAVVVHGNGLGAGASLNVATGGVVGELEELVISVLLVLGLAGGPDIVIDSLFLEAVDTGGWGGGVRVP